MVLLWRNDQEKYAFKTLQHDVEAVKWTNSQRLSWQTPARVLQVAYQKNCTAAKKDASTRFGSLY